MGTPIDALIHVPTLRGGGAERVAIRIAEHFAEQGIATALFVHDRSTDFAVPHGIELIVAASPRHLGRVAELRRLLIRRRVRSVVSLLPYANLLSFVARLGRARHTRLVVSEHIPYSCRPGFAKERVKTWLTTNMYPFTDAVVAVSRGIAAELDGLMPRIGHRNLIVIHNPCYIPAEVPLTPRRSGSPKHVVAVGRLVQLKGFDMLIRAFARVRAAHRDATLTIVGEGPERACLEALVETEALTEYVTLPGFREDIGSAFRDADLFVCASRAEGFGNVIVEALSFGLPVVSTDCPHGPAEILENGRFGTLVPVDDETALARAIVEALDHPADPLHQIMRAREFSLERIGAQYLQAAGFAP
ncbi:glycosyltransferase [Burkholderia ambifaria]|uniref:glycosyltransferase n=1 Tax=Burkholderia ambifaria TaxID=152480 RepID=UPI00158915FC|nr:glycosyltransferase [Burkholderia ambifaria]MBR8342422.1 glycosyltransferase [Burkholderia ambifaria]